MVRNCRTLLLLVGSLACGRGVPWLVDSQPTMGKGVPFACLPETPDGTPCELWWEPCVTDAHCVQGACHSQTAEAEKPGDLRWRVQFSGTADPQAVDDDGNVYVLAGGPGPGDTQVQGPVVAALDACGRILWQRSADGDQIMLGAEGQLIVTSPSGLVTALNRQDGGDLWNVDLTSVFSHDEYSWVGAASLSNQGNLYLASGSYTTNTCTVVALGDDGRKLWEQAFPSNDACEIGEQVTDLNGNLYLGVERSYSLVSLTPTGSIRYRDAMPGPNFPLVLGGDRLFDGQGDAWWPDGGFVPSSFQPLDGGYWGMVIDENDGVFAAASTSGELLAQASSGSPLWTIQNLSAEVALLALGQAEVFGATTVTGTSNDSFVPDAGILMAADRATGTVLWSVPIAPTFELVLTNSASVIVDDEQSGVASYFAGKTKPSTIAYWPRSHGGDGTNRYSPPATAGQ